MIVLIGAHLRMARAGLGWTQEQLAGKAKVALGTLIRMESADEPVSGRTETLRRIVAVLESAGVEFLNDKTPGVRLRR